MTSLEQQALIVRYRRAAVELNRAIASSEALASYFGLMYLQDYLAADLMLELTLRDVFEAARDELLAELMLVDVIPFDDGYYKVDALGCPKFYAGVPEGVLT